MSLFARRQTAEIKGQPKNHLLKMSFFKKDENGKSIAWLIFAGIFALLFGWIYYQVKRTRGKYNKSKLAERYGVKTKVLMRWLELFGSEEAKKLYISTPIRKVESRYFVECLGDPAFASEHLKKAIVSKSQLYAASGKSETTCFNKIRGTENPEKTIGMPYETYASLKFLPPKYIDLLLRFLKYETEEIDFFPDLTEKFKETGS